MRIDLPPEIEARLAKLAQEREVPLDQVVVELLTAQLEYNTWFCAEVEKGRSSMAAGRYATHEEVKARLAKYL